MPKCEPICPYLSATSFQSQFRSQHIPAPHAGRTAPEQERQEDHEERVGAEVGREGEVGVKRWRAHFLLHPS